ncbi:MAG: hypothetical protein H0U46_11850 [Actinobacteria bacterium]|nr:hypothetical protein [Actinomycetota bacterium]
MNQRALKHVQKAGDYLAKGDGFYNRAAAEMSSAKAEGATWVEIGDSLCRSSSWCKKIVSWAKTPANSGSAPTPFAEPGRDTTDVRGAKRILAEAPLEQVEQIVSELPADRQRAVAAAAGHQYLKARQDYAEEEARLSPAQRKEREAAKETITRPAREIRATFGTMSIAQHIEAATEKMRELVGDASLTPDNLEAIDKAFAEFSAEYQVARAMAGLEESWQS